MTKTFYIPLLAALPALLGSCGPHLDQYQRLGFNSYEQCIAAYQPQLQQGLQNPCVRNTSSVSGGFMYFGPYIYNTGASTRYVGYDASGSPARSGLTYDSRSGRYGSFKAPGVSRGGFTTGSRSSGRSSGSFGG